jgi:hypothetical protein
MNISYVDMWPGFDPNCNWFNLLFLDYFDGKPINFNSPLNEANIVIFSSFGFQHLNITNNKTIKIFYTGENHRPPHYCDFSLSFDSDSYGGKNLRLPIWYLYINWWNQPNFPHARITPEMLLKQWDPQEIIDRPHFCSIIIGNPVSNRIEAAQSLNTIKPVHGYGTVFGNAYSGDKIELLKNYKYNICFENTIAKDYTTEKLLEAKVAGCIPIYYGYQPNDFNPYSYINYSEFKNTNAFIKNIQCLETDKSLCCNIINEKLFNKNPTLDFIYLFFNKIFKGEKNEL